MDWSSFWLGVLIGVHFTCALVSWGILAPPDR